MQSANIPCLAMVLYQLTGEGAWLEEPYRPRRLKGIDDDDSGGLPTSAQDELRDAAAVAVARWAHGAAAAVDRPEGSQLRKMMSVCVGEEVSQEYETMMAVEMGFHEPPDLPAADDTLPFVAVIGAGIGGLTVALALRQAGVPYIVFERNSDVGGVWLVNKYPGAGVDTPSFLYSWSFFPRIWSNYFAKREEVLSYIGNMADHYELRSSIRFDASVEKLNYDEQRQCWAITVCTDEGTTVISADAVVSAVGVFGEPTVPDIPGMGEFAGRLFHSSDWPPDLDVVGKRLAIVGTGASAMQIVPAVSETAAAVGVFQRSAQWIAPASKYFTPLDSDARWLMEAVPYYLKWYRFRLAWLFGDKRHASLQVDPTWTGHPFAINRTSDFLRRILGEYMAAQLDGRPDLINRAAPNYPPYGKRMLLDNGWYKAIRRPNIELFGEPVEKITAEAVVDASGREWKADVVVLCTGFQAQRYLHPIEVVGRDGVRLADAWSDDDARAYLGLMTPGFPNLFFIYGPNTNSGGGSFFSLAESQAKYLTSALVRMSQENVKTIEPRYEAFARYNQAVDDAHEKMVWTHPGLRTYYRNSRGRVVVNMPWRGVDYWNMVRVPDFEDMLTLPAGGTKPCTAIPPDGIR